MRSPFISRQTRLTKAPRRSRSSRKIGRGFEQLEDRRLLATIPVTLASDAASPIGDGEITLREAISYVNGINVPQGDQAAFDFANLGTNDTIIFAPSLDGVPIVLGIDSNGTKVGFGELTITNPVTIDAQGQAITIDASGNDPTPNSTLDDGDPDNDGDGTTVFDIVYPVASQGVSLTYVLAGLTITGGDSPDENDSIGDGVHQGGGITLRNGSYAPSLGQVSLTIRDSVVTGNHSNGDGGGIYAKSYEGETIDFVIERSVISGNTSGDTSVGPLVDHEKGNGGGIAVNMPGFGHTDASGFKFTLTESVVESNEAVNRGGGIFLAAGAGGVIDIKDSTISGNAAGISLLGRSPYTAENPNSGGGIYAYLFSGDDGIGVLDPNNNNDEDKFAKLTITGTTVDNNQAGNHGGGIFSNRSRVQSVVRSFSKVAILPEWRPRTT